MAEQEGARMEATFMVQSLCPDVCKSPVVPVPYPIVAYLDKSVMVSPNVRSNGVPVFHMGSRVATVIGDEAGVGGGVTSLVNLGFCKPIVPVPSVRVNGQFANDSDITYMLMNGASPEGPFNTIGQLKYLPPMYFADVGPGGTVPPGDPSVAAETDAEGGFLGKLTDMAGNASVSDVVSMAKTAYGLATTDWSNPAAVLGAIGSAAGVAQMGGLAKAAQLAQKGYQLATTDWSNPGAALGAIMGAAGPMIGGASGIANVLGGGAAGVPPTGSTPGINPNAGSTPPDLPPGLVCCGGFGL